MKHPWPHNKGRWRG